MKASVEHGRELGGMWHAKATKTALSRYGSSSSCTLVWPAEVRANRGGSWRAQRVLTRRVQSLRLLPTAPLLEIVVAMSWIELARRKCVARNNAELVWPWLSWLRIIRWIGGGRAATQHEDWNWGKLAGCVYAAMRSSTTTFIV